MVSETRERDVSLCIWSAPRRLRVSLRRTRRPRAAPPRANVAARGVASRRLRTRYTRARTFYRPPRARGRVRVPRREGSVAREHRGGIGRGVSRARGVRGGRSRGSAGSRRERREVGGVLGVRVGACAGGAVEVGSDEVRRDLRDGDAGRRRRGRGQRRVESSERSRTARGRVRQQDGAATGREDDALGREDDDRAVAGVVARDVVPSERLAHLAPAAHFPHSTSERRVVEAYLAEVGVAGVRRHVGAHGSHDAKRAHGTLGVARHLAEAAVERGYPRRRHPRHVASGGGGGCLLGTSRRRGRHGRRQRPIGASRARREVRQPSQDAPLSAPSEPRRGRAGRGRRARLGRADDAFGTHNLKKLVRPHSRCLARRFQSWHQI